MARTGSHETGSHGTGGQTSAGGRAGAGGEHVETHQHADVQGGAARAAVFGVSDGLVSNLGLMLGVAGADPQPGVVRLAGLAGLIAGAVSMAAGEYNSMRVQAELLERELRIEARELRRRPRAETAELTRLYERRGLARRQAEEMAAAVMRDPEQALEVHAREELGIDPSQLGSPPAAAASSFAAFSVGALVPLLPWFVAAGDVATLASLVLGVLCAVAVGALVARSTDRPVHRAVARQVAFTVVPAAITFGIGSALGVGVA
ncbi:MAG TPA: VIT1/CCC1 transporter family protein [Acidimicrobiales bacterium]